jgi:hypothetical protein
MDKDCVFCNQSYLPEEPMPAIRVVYDHVEDKWYMECRTCLSRGPLSKTLDKALENWGRRYIT